VVTSSINEGDTLIIDTGKEEGKLELKVDQKIETSSKE
jgi:hypothetical protein